MYKKFSVNVGLFICLSLLSACSSVDYFSHLAKGQFDLLWKRQTVAELLESEEISEQLRERLLLAEKIRHFAEAKLMLPVDDAYSSYTDLRRDYVVWNVYAAPELSLEAYTWCYPILGCMAYRGYYEESRAREAAKDLEEQGYDVKVGGVKAYSTLGFFDDPLLNTFIFIQEPAFIELLIHELAHRKLYIKDDTAFNENFASAVGYLGARQWYAEYAREAEFERFTLYKERIQALIDFLLHYKERLSEIYSDESLAYEQKRILKQQTMASLHDDYRVFKYERAWDNRFDQWVSSMNNAGFATLSNYQQWVPAFLRLFEQHEGHWPAFYRAVEELSEREKNERLRQLNSLLEPVSKDTVSSYTGEDAKALGVN